MNANTSKTSKAGESIAPAYRVDMGVGVLQEITHLTDNLVNAFYDLDTEGIDHGMDELFFASLGATELFAQNWSGKDDEFTAWVSTERVGAP